MQLIQNSSLSGQDLLGQPWLASWALMVRIGIIRLSLLCTETMKV